MRILFIATGLATGGAEKQVLELALGQQAAGHEIQVASLLPPQGLQQDLLNAGIPVFCLQMRRGAPNPMACMRLANIIRIFRPDIVHSHMIHANLLARVTRLICKMPVLVCTAHSMYEVSAREKRSQQYSIRDFLYWLTDSLADVTTQICQAGAQRYLRVKAISKKRLRVVYNGLNVDRFAPVPGLREKKRRELGLDDQWVWLAVGNFEKAKDYPNMLNAFVRFHNSHPSDKLIIAGDGFLRPEIEKLCAALNLQDVVKFLGLRKDVRELMQAADAIVMSSKFEGMPMALIEAHASGLPVVATNVGGNAEVVRDGISGFLCEPLNAPALTEAMLRMRSQPREATATMGASGKAHVHEYFALSRIIAEWEKLYRELNTKL